ncbi:MAG: hypothetical protein ACXVSX_00695 [Solirubrobacteraceae bacterium]
MNSRRTAAFAALGVTVALAGVGCGGGGSDYKNNPRPASPIIITASVSDKSVSVSPRRFGAGPISVIVTNQTSAAQKVTLETDTGPTSSSPGIKQETAPISPQDTATLKLDVKPGRYSVHVDGGSIRAAILRVGKPRASAQNDLLQP